MGRGASQADGLGGEGLLFVGRGSSRADELGRLGILFSGRGASRADGIGEGAVPFVGRGASGTSGLGEGGLPFVSRGASRASELAGGWPAPCAWSESEWLCVVATGPSQSIFHAPGIGKLSNIVSTSIRMKHLIQKLETKRNISCLRK